MLLAIDLSEHTLMLVSGVGGVLLFVSLIGLALKAAIADGRPHAVIDNLNARVRAWWLLAALFGSALIAGRFGVTLLFALASFMALREYVATSPRAFEPSLLACSLAVALPLQYAFAALGWAGFLAVVMPAYAFVVLPVIAMLIGHADSLRRIAPLQWGLMLCVFCISYVPALLTLDIAGYSERNSFLLVFFVLVVQSSDVLQYVWGKLAGRHAIAPAISPSKTIEGTLGGMASATALGTMLAPITPFSAPQAMAVSLLLTVLGFAGGLTLSAIKRSRGIKDWGTSIQGHGGVLDRLDSIWLSAPVFYYLVRCGWT